MEWDENAIGRLRALWIEGHSTAEIGRRMGVSKNAVVGKAHRLCLTSRPSPIRREGDKGPRRRQPRRASATTLPMLAASQVSHAAEQPGAAVRLERITERQPTVLRAVPIARPSTRIHPCCWPIGEPGTRSFRFCDEASVSGKPYCEQHAALAYVKVRDRREDAA